MDEELTEKERARLRSLVAFQKLVLGIAMHWWLLFVFVFLAFGAGFSGYLWMRGSKSVKRYEATTRLMFAPKKIHHIDPLGDKQLMTILERPSLKRRVAERYTMDDAERMCLVSDMQISQGKKQGNLFILTAASKTRGGAFVKANAYADILIEEYVAFRSKDLDNWRKSLEGRRSELAVKLSEVEAEESALKAKTGALTPNEALVALNALISDQRRNDSVLGVDMANEEIKKRKLEESVGKSGETVKANAAAIRKRVDAIASIEKDLEKLREKYTEINPRVAGKVSERAERIAELEAFLKAKGAVDVDLDKIDMIEKAAGDLADCTTRIEAIAEKRTALRREISDNEKRAAELAKVVMDFERIEARRTDILASVRDVDEQLSGISYAIVSMKNDLRQIERTVGADDNGPFGAKKAVIACGGAFVLATGLLVFIVICELSFGKVRDGREIAVYDGMDFIGSVPAKGAVPEEEAREANRVIALKTLLAAKDSKTIFVCRLPGAGKCDAFADAMDYTASMSGARCFFLDIVQQEGFAPPEGSEEMIGVVKKDQHGWFPAANRYALAPTELQMLKADIATIGGEFDNIFLRIDGAVRVGGTFYDQLLEICDAVFLMVADRKTPRRAFAYARRHLAASGKVVIAIATESNAKNVRAGMEVMS